LGDLTVGQPCTFYAAKDTIFSPFGHWKVRIYKRCHVGTDSVFQNFSLERSNVNRVDITAEVVYSTYDLKIYTGGKRTPEALEETAGQPEAPASRTAAREVSVNAWLGDSKDNSSGIPESDVFSFFGADGDTVTIRLEADTKGGNNGGFATLRLLTDFGPVHEVTGKLPQTITLGSAVEARRYQIAVEQPTGGRGDADYIGGYILRVESAQGAIKTLTPARSVEK
jgi:hypothetical protein